MEPEEHGDRPSLADINLTVTVSARAKAARARWLLHSRTSSQRDLLPN